MSNAFVTVLGGRFNIKDKLLHVVRAGHLPLYYFDSHADVIRQSCPRGIGLGLSGDDIFENSIEETTFKFKTGDIFLFISDGILESRNQKGEQFGDERLSEIIVTNHSKKSSEIVNEIIKAVSVFSENAFQFDDITLVAVKIEKTARK